MRTTVLGLLVFGSLFMTLSAQTGRVPGNKRKHHLNVDGQGRGAGRIVGVSLRAGRESESPRASRNASCSIRGHPCNICPAKRPD